MTIKRLNGVRLDFLDQLRAFAIIPVVIQHYHSDWLPGGGIGVGIFFALSGFLIGSILLELDSVNVCEVTKFMVRRFMRIYPMYLVSLISILALAIVSSSGRTLQIAHSLVGLLLFIRMPEVWLGYGIGVLWTLHIEFIFYVAAAVFVLSFGSRIGLWMLATILIASSFLTHFFQFLNIPILHWGGALAMGTLVALAWKYSLMNIIVTYWWHLAALSLTGLIALLFAPPSTTPLWTGEVMLASFFASIVISLFLANSNMPIIPLAPWIGRISFSIYLIHGVVLDSGIEMNLPIYRFRIFFAVALLMLSWTTYRFIELPGIRFGKAISLRISRRQNGT